MALIVYDRDSPLRSNFVHWLLYNVPPKENTLPEGLPKESQLSDGLRQGRNGHGDVGYAGPCPPGQGAHHYVFNLYVLDTTPNLPPASSETELVKALTGHVIAGGQLIAVFQK